MNNKVFISDRAFISILAETKERMQTETGGILLGHREGDAWHVIESIDPGPTSIFTPTYFEYDHPYVNHLANKVAKLYQVKLQVIGLWHRHPGSMDRFSSTDDGTNKDFALKLNGAISGIVNLDPKFRLTMYYVSIDLNYEKVAFEVGDSLIPKKYLEQRNSEVLKDSLVIDYSLRRNQPQQLQPGNLNGNQNAEAEKKEGVLKALPAEESPGENTNQIGLDSRLNNQNLENKKNKIDYKKEKLVNSFLETLNKDLNWLNGNEFINHNIKMQGSNFVLEVFQQDNMGNRVSNEFRFYYDINRWAVLYKKGFTNYYQGFIKNYLSNTF